MLDYAKAGFHFIIYLAEWHGWINNKMGGILENLAIAAEYFKDCFTALGLLEGKVEYLRASDIVDTIESISGVKKVHDLHIWSVEPRIVMLTCHVLVDTNTVPDKDQLLQPIQATLSSKFGIHHLTLQLETECPETEDLHCNLGYLTNKSSAKEPILPHLHRH